MIKIGEDQDKVVTYENEPNVDRKLFPNIPLTVDIGPLEDEIDGLDERLTSAEGSITSIIEEMRTYNGQPVPVDLVADMTDENKIYVYLGEEAGYTAGYWYYYDGSDWVAGGEYVANPVTIDDTLTQTGEAADAKATGDAIDDVKADFSEFQENTFDIIPPTDYGALITSDDCAASKANVLTYTDTENGILITKSARENVGLYVYFNDIPTASQAEPVTYDFTITVDSTTGIDAVYFYDGSTQVGSYSGGTITKDGNTYSFSYTYQNQSKLRWQIGLLYSFQSTKTITSITGVIQNAETVYKIVPSTIKWYLDDIYGANFDAPKNGIKVNKVYTSLWSQGACAVGEYYIGFDASADDHSTNGNMYIGLFSEMPTRYTAHHNLGHCASADYNATTDTMIVGNGTVDTTTPPIIYLVKGAHSIAENRTDIAYNGSNVVAVDLTGIHGTGGCVACFGENHYIVYVITTDNNATPFTKTNKKHIYRCVMGLGANDMVTAYPSESYGTFISDCAVTEYNGTLRVLEEWEIEFSGELQGLKYGNGYLILPMDTYKSNVLTSYLVYIKLQDEAVIDKVYWIPVVQASSGSLVRTECEDVIFHDGNGYVVTITTDGSTKIYRTHAFHM